MASPAERTRSRQAPAGAGPLHQQGRPADPGLARHHRRLAHHRPAVPRRHRANLVPLRRCELRRRVGRARRPQAGAVHHVGRCAEPWWRRAPARRRGTVGATFDQVLAVARDAGLSGPVEISPGTPGTAWAVAQTDNTWPVRLDQVAVDPGTNTVTARNDYADWSLLAKLSALGVQAHMGLLFGVLNQILLAALAVGLLCVIVWGYRMWWQRRPTRADRRSPVGAPPARGGLGVPVAVAVGWALPWFGIPLLGFLVADVVVGVFARRRAGRRGDPAPTSAG
ncbi:PepSY domain-containing protein [Verrucosispora sioxanthis]|uniref:PepSY domain-containing protein n=1 Tax=Verrucosispora sioxanthis TaxID=2499994 RepID=UPI00281528DF|nr:PepSY domain-containing protein [Verrucosispora sioxanthis]